MYTVSFSHPEATSDTIFPLYAFEEKYYMYTFLTDEHGKIDAILSFLNDGQSQSSVRNELDAWNAKNLKLDLSATFPPFVRIFLDAEQVVNGCRASGAMLHVNQNGAFATDAPTQIVDQTLHRLCQTWAFDEKKMERSPRSGFGGRPGNLWAPSSVTAELNRQLQLDEEGARRVSSWPIIRTFVFLDVSDFSKFPAGQEALVISSLVWLVNEKLCWASGGAEELYDTFKAQLCIGDGYIYVFREPLVATRFAAYLACLIEFAAAQKWLPVEFHFRVGIHVGEVDTFYDRGRKDWNYIGDGINGGNRVLGAVGKDTDDVIFVSGALRLELLGIDNQIARAVLQHLNNRGRKEDKHKNMWRVYELNHTGLFGDRRPRVR